MKPQFNTRLKLASTNTKGLVREVYDYQSFIDKKTSEIEDMS